MRLHLIGSDDEISAYVELDDGAMCPVTNFIGPEGDETDEIDDTCAVVAQMPNGQWLSMEVFPDDLEEVSLLQ